MADERKGISKLLLDSALIIGIVTAVCYVLGFLAEMRESQITGIPRHLLPQVQPEQTLAIGGMYALELLALGLIIYLLMAFIVALVSKVSPSKALRAKQYIISNIINKYNNSKTIYDLIIIFIVGTGLYLSPGYLERASEWLVGTVSRPRVISLVLNDPKINVDWNDLVYIGKREGSLILLRQKPRTIVLLKADDVKLIVMTGMSFPLSVNPVPQPPNSRIKDGPFSEKTSKTRVFTPY